MPIAAVTVVKSAREVADKERRAPTPLLVIDDGHPALGVVLRMLAPLWVPDVVGHMDDAFERLTVAYRAVLVLSGADTTRALRFHERLMREQPAMAARTVYVCSGALPATITAAAAGTLSGPALATGRLLVLLKRLCD